jgi:hypothetical protein
VLPQRLEQLADLVGNEEFVREPIDRGELIAAGRRPARRHHRVLVPAEQPPCSLEVVDDAEPLAQLDEAFLVSHLAVSAPVV